MFDFILGIAMLAIGLKFLHGTLSRGRSLVKAKVAGISVPFQWIQIVLSLLIAACGLYLLLR